MLAVIVDKLKLWLTFKMFIKLYLLIIYFYNYLQNIYLCQTLVIKMCHKNLWHKHFKNPSNICQNKHFRKRNGIYVKRMWKIFYSNKQLAIFFCVMPHMNVTDESVVFLAITWCGISPGIYELVPKQQSCRQISISEMWHWMFALGKSWVCNSQGFCE